jgi:hypothetical protein
MAAWLYLAMPIDMSATMILVASSSPGGGEGGGLSSPKTSRGGAGGGGSFIHPIDASSTPGVSSASVEVASWNDVIELPPREGRPPAARAITTPERRPSVR